MPLGPKTAVDFVAQQVQAADNLGLRSADVNISEATGTFSKAFEALGQDPRMGGSQAFNIGGRSIRTMDELQSAVDAVIRVTGQQGVQMFRPEQVKVKVPGGSVMKTRQRPVAEPDAGDVMTFLGLSSGEQRKLGRCDGSAVSELRNWVSDLSSLAVSPLAALNLTLSA